MKYLRNYEMSMSLTTEEGNYVMTSMGSWNIKYKIITRN